MTDPIALFTHWLDTAKGHPAIAEPTAMSLATVGENGKPSVRIVLLKSVDAQGFTFFTNLNSRKSGEIKAHHDVALCFWWMALERQVRIEGRAEPVSDAEADAYFAGRARISQIGAWSSQQSQWLPDRDILLQAVAENSERFEGKAVPRPPHWSGWRVVPHTIEFWQQGDFRLHDREVYTRTLEGWENHKLYP